MELYETRLQVCLTAINKMFRDTHFDICVIDNCIKTLEIKKEEVSHQILRTLHCVHYSEMPISVIEQIPDLIRRCLGDAICVDLKAVGEAAEAEHKEKTGKSIFQKVLSWLI